MSEAPLYVARGVRIDPQEVIGWSQGPMVGRVSLQGHLAHKKPTLPRNLQ
jgi:hypothetical protein